MGLVRGTKEQSNEIFFLKTAFYPVKVFIKSIYFVSLASHLIKILIMVTQGQKKGLELGNVVHDLVVQDSCRP